MSGEPDPKAGPRIVDPKAVRAALLADRECRACGRAASNPHHLIQKGSPHFGDDVAANIVSVCGTGTMGCHGALHGCPYTDDSGRRWTPEEVKQAIGLGLDSLNIGYVIGKLGGFDRADEYLRREYRVRLIWTFSGKQAIATVAA